MTINDIINRSSRFDQKDKDLIKNNGVVFTDRKICDIIIERINPSINDVICEPSVGKGAFVFSLLEFFKKKHTILELVEFTENRLHCFDINNSFINELKILLINYFIIQGYDKPPNLNNLKCEDFLLDNNHYDVIIGNPPYVRIQNMDKEYLNKLKENLKSVTLGNVDLYYAFLEKSLQASNKVGLIIPNSFIKNKSGKFIREIIKDRVSYIYDFENNKVWENISTYTSIVICENTTDVINYQTNTKLISKNKSELTSDIWIFEDIETGTNNLSDMIISYNGGLATIKDNIYKMDSYDDNYCYKDGYMIEKGICEKYIKGTKDRTFGDHKYILYPYDETILDENILSHKYPLAYKYLCDKKEDLSTRDKGKIDKYESWYAYGRKQGMMKKKQGTQVILPLTFLKSRGIHCIEIPTEENSLVLSGILVDIIQDRFEEFMKVISSEEFYKYCELNNKILSDKNRVGDKWLCVTVNTLRNFKY